MTRYDISSSEGRYAANPDTQVLENKLGLFDIEEINGAELVLLEKLYQSIFEDNFPQSVITVDMLKHWHYRWLGNIYEWAGFERSVNISKGGFLFAPAAQLPKLLNSFETECLSQFTPCSSMGRDRIIEAIAITHVELILIHPFREGNGRLARLLADVMAVQGGFGPLNYRSWEENRSQYIAAIHAGLSMNYEPIKHWVQRAFEAD
ncbi:Fic family protein [Enterobacteriaceae bacterium H20N1]|uniref:Fic family protein n=1 Tax=Dryocola boscaweniae TaxID=2925397 RepID=A0A9X2W6U1_9ENTR|nr:Fic family protein [Dryocola boscaweniae]MCT4701642.1 Fic family protein [Dryocola boscaweniae]MCT4716286.1 Fic family protein [Dryocola boscaweniae]MCT4718811.1 Fic family protein [Dryocola boscaweniae]